MDCDCDVFTLKFCQRHKAERESAVHARISALREELGRANKETDQLRTQLAGCGVAAYGFTKDPCPRDAWGWSDSYQATLDLRVKYDALLELVRELRACDGHLRGDNTRAAWDASRYVAVSEKIDETVKLDPSVHAAIITPPYDDALAKMGEGPKQPGAPA